MNQIIQTKSFFSNKEKTLIINEVNNDIGSIYKYIIRYYANLNKIKLIFEEDTSNVNNPNDLFEITNIKVFSTISFKNIDKILNFDEKKIIITDYKCFKKLNSKFNCINGYSYKQDTNKFFKDELNIHNQTLIDFCVENPVLILSELSKFIVNSKNYIQDRNLEEASNLILDLRKNIYNSKLKNELKHIYDDIKKEAQFKKFSFLTYL